MAVGGGRYAAALLLLAGSLAACAPVRDSLEGDKLVIPPVSVTVTTDKIPPAAPAVPAEATPPKPALPSSPPAPAHLLPESLPEQPPALHAIGQPERFLQRALLTEDTTWEGEVLVEGGVSVAPQATLTIAPGTIVRFRAGRQGGEPLLLVQGRLVASGTAERPIRFLAEERGGSWGGILVLASEKKNLLEQCQIEAALVGVEALYAQLALRQVQVSGSRTGFRLQDTVASLIGGQVSGCEDALELVDSEVELNELQLVGNGRGLVAMRSSVYLAASLVSGNRQEGAELKECRFKVVSGQFLDNRNGLVLQGGEGTLQGSRLSRNLESGLSVAGCRVRVQGNELRQNRRYGAVTADGQAVLWGNSFGDNGQADLRHDGSATLRAVSNWWGGETADAVPRVQQGAGSQTLRVSLQPVLRQRPELPPVKGFAK